MTKPPSSAAVLRRLAEARVRKKRDLKSTLTPRRLLHELQVHQIELEMQNAELQEASNQREVLLEKYTDLYEFAPVGYFTLTADSKIHQVNLTGARLVGMERSRLLGRPLTRHVVADLQPVFHAFLKRVFAGEGKQSCEVMLLRGGQPAQAVSIEARRSPDKLECRAAMMDITDRKQVEDRVRASEIRYRRLFEAAHDGVLILDPETRKITDANPFMTRLLGYSHDQLVGKELFEIGLLKDEAASQEMFRKLKRKHEVRYEDLPLETQGGGHQEVEVVANLYAEGRHSVIQCNIRDITERKLAEDLRRRNEALFSALIDQAPVGIFVLDAGFRLRQVNPKAMPLFGGIRPLIGRDFSEIHHILWPKRVSDEIVARFRHTLKTGESYQSPEFTGRRRDTGAKEVYEWQIQRVTLPAGEFGVVCFFLDITERKRAERVQRHLELLTASNAKFKQEIARRQSVEQTLKKAKREQSRLLEQSQQQQEQLRELSHQVLHAQEEERKRISRELHDVIGQTLVGINVHLAALARGTADNQRSLHQKIAETQRLVEKSADIVHRFARELRPTLLDDLGLIPALQSLMKSYTEETGVRVSLRAFAGVEKARAGTRTVLYRVVQQSLSNIARHAHASRAEVSLLLLPGVIRLEIKDNGKGFKVEGALCAKKNGRLGLLGMRERVEMVGGTFSVESAPGSETTVRADIPLEKSAAGKKLLKRALPSR
ncbi:MAG: PAS domain S-box protein [Terrimicrobiaceae bacterium]